MTTELSKGAPVDKDVLLFIIGGLGDWCVRRVLGDATQFKPESSRVHVVVVDLHPHEPSDSFKQWMEVIDRWIVRRLIEQSAEEIDQPLPSQVGRKGIYWRWQAKLAGDPRLPDPTDPNVHLSSNDAINALKKRCGPVFKAAWEKRSEELKRYVNEQLSGFSETLGDKGDSDLHKQLVQQTQALIDRVRARLERTRSQLTEWLQQTLTLDRLGSVHRYWRSVPEENLLVVQRDDDKNIEVRNEQLCHLAKTYRIIVYVATPPECYAEIVNDWSPFAERIALEKPVAGLLRRNSSKQYELAQAGGAEIVNTTKAIRDAVDKACEVNERRIAGVPDLTVVTIDHYNTKWAVQAAQWLQRRKIADSILKSPRRVCIEVLEGGVLPRGRFLFYNGVGGALADMITHLIQPLRAIAGYRSVEELLDDLTLDPAACAGSAGAAGPVARARYRQTEEPPPAFGKGCVTREELENNLYAGTETFGVIALKFQGGKWLGTPVYIRTGKGFVPQSKTVVVESFDCDGPVALICDIQERNIRFALSGPKWGRERPDRVWMQTQEIEVPGPDGRPLRPGAAEYVAVFKALCGQPPPDRTYFPPVDEAAAVCDFFYSELLRDRARCDQRLSATYQADYVAEEVRGWCPEAGWS